MKIKIRTITEIGQGKKNNTSKVFNVVISDGSSTTTVEVSFSDPLPTGISHDVVILKRIQKEVAKINLLENLPTYITITSADFSI